MLKLLGEGCYGKVYLIEQEQELLALKKSSVSMEKEIDCLQRLGKYPKISYIVDMHDHHSFTMKYFHDYQDLGDFLNQNLEWNLLDALKFREYMLEFPDEITSSDRLDFENILKKGKLSESDIPSDLEKIVEEIQIAKENFLRILTPIRDQMIEILDYICSKGVTHLDLDEGRNIMVNSDLEVCLIDFGMSKIDNEYFKDADFRRFREYLCEIVMKNFSRREKEDFTRSLLEKME